MYLLFLYIVVVELGANFYKSMLGLLCMANDSGLGAGFGGLMRYKEEYNSKLKFGPGVVVGMIIGVIVLVVGLRILLT